MNRWIPAYVALGSNESSSLGDPRQQIEMAFERLGGLQDTRLIARSRLYRTSPMGPQDQPHFINAAAGMLTQLGPQEMLAGLKGIETAMGRTPPARRWGPRLIDLDLLLHGSAAMEGAQLTLPHPGLHERNFVLYPLADIAPALRLPGRGPVAMLARQVGSGGMQVVE